MMSANLCSQYKDIFLKKGPLGKRGISSSESGFRAALFWILLLVWGKSRLNNIPTWEKLLCKALGDGTAKKYHREIW